MVTERLKNLQTHLGVQPDGLIGPETLTAIETALGCAKPPPNLTFRVGYLLVELDQLFEIERFETGGRRDIPERLHWPGGGSGATIGIGYDLGYHSRDEVRADWIESGRLFGDAANDALLMAVGVRGKPARVSVGSFIEVHGDRVTEYRHAKAVFHKRTLVKYAAMLVDAMPGVEKLPSRAQGALLSLAVNRGVSLIGPRRKEMLGIAESVAAADGDEWDLVAGFIARDIRAMKRLWPDLPGLIKRREWEASEIERSVKP